MSIKPVLVPDQDAKTLRALLETFDAAATGTAKKQLTESIESGVSEGVADTKQLLQAYAGLYYNSRESAGNDMDYDAIQREMDQIEQQIAKQYGPAGVKKLQKYGYEQYHGQGSFDDDVVREAGVAEATMSRAAKGYEKYGREGMAALARAGREGRALDPIRDKYDRYDEGAESENLAIGEKMARDGIEYDPAREGEIISMIGDYLRRDGMTTRQVRGYMIDPDFISDQLSYLPRKSGVAEAAEAAFKAGDRVMYAGRFATIVAQDGDAYGVKVDGQPGTMKVPASALKKPSYDESIEESRDPVEQLRADIRRFAQ